VLGAVPSSSAGWSYRCVVLERSLRASSEVWSDQWKRRPGDRWKRRPGGRRML